MSDIVIQKFGGTSVASIDHIKNVVFFIKSAIKSGYKPVVVVSAMAGVTNSLVAMCSEVSKLDSAEKLSSSDAALASGESVSAALLALALQEAGVCAKPLAGWQIPITTNGSYGNALVDSIDTKEIMQIIEMGCVPVVSGFQGVDKTGRITTLGRGGSDTSAAVLSAALGGALCDIYSDVEGIYDADPRIVDQARKIDKLCTAQAVNFAGNGAKILHLRAAQVAAMYDLRMRILSSFDKCDNYSDIENSKGTLITKMEQIEKTKIIGITSKQNFCMVRISIQEDQDILTKIIEAGIDIDCLMHSSPGSIALITLKKSEGAIKSLLLDIKSKGVITDFDINTQITQISIVGYRLKDEPNIISKIYDILGNWAAELHAIQTDDSVIKIVTGALKSEKVIKLLHKNLIEPKG